MKWLHKKLGVIGSLDDKGEMCIFIGYSKVTKNHKLYDLQAKKVIFSGDIILDEQVLWDWPSNEYGASVQIHLKEQSVDQSMQATSAPIMSKSSRHPQCQHILLACLQDCVVGGDTDPWWPSGKVKCTAKA